MGWQQTQTLYCHIRATDQLRRRISVDHSTELNQNRSIFLAANYGIGSAKSESSIFYCWPQNILKQFCPASRNVATTTENIIELSPILFTPPTQTRRSCLVRVTTNKSCLLCSFVSLMFLELDRTRRLQ